MEILHLSLKRVINAGLYKGILLNVSFMISHLFYADDVVFVGEWNASNIKIVASVLKCFYLASGHKINFQKSKLMGIGVNSDEVERAASMVGCCTFTSPFRYLGVKVRGNMSRIESWDKTIVATSTTEAEYVAAASCCGQVLWIQNQLLDYGEISILSCNYWNGESLTMSDFVFVYSDI
nr:RNA-directed DNA polymerase, eukaryota [Tanacetum cinerariifolium]